MAKAPTKKQQKSGLVEKVSKLSSVAKAAIFLGTAAVVGGAFYGLVLVPYEEQLASLKGAISKTASDIQAQETALQKHKAVEKLIPAVDGTYEYIQQYLPQENEMPQLVQMVAQIGSQAGLTDGVTMFAPQLPAQLRANYAEIPFALTLQGEFKSVLTFLYDFSRMNRIVNITNVSIGSPKMVDPQLEIFHIDVKCSGSTYRSLTEAEVSSASQQGKGKGKGRR